jgi:hypothetical protein
VRWAHIACHPYAVTARPRVGHRGWAHDLAPARPRDRPRARSRWSGAPSPRPSRPIHLAFMHALSSSRRPTNLPSLAFAQALLRAASRARHCRRSELAGAPLGPSPPREFEHHESLHLHPWNTPVHAHWLDDSPARRHCGRRGRPPPPSPPTVAGAVSRQANPANRLRVSPNPTLAAYSPESGRPSLPAGLAPPPGTFL